MTHTNAIQSFNNMHLIKNAYRSFCFIVMILSLLNKSLEAAFFTNESFMTNERSRPQPSKYALAKSAFCHRKQITTVILSRPSTIIRDSNKDAFLLDHSCFDHGIQILHQLRKIHEETIHGMLFKNRWFRFIACTLLFASLFSVSAPDISFAKSYSTNAKNFERINAGDLSGGSVYDNNPRTEGSRKRRALTGCKIQSTREEASIEILNLGKKSILSEKECTTKVLEGDTEFMLQAIRNLECPTCPYGINPNRKDVRL